MAEKYTLRPYQQSAVNAAVSFLTETHKGNCTNGFRQKPSLGKYRPAARRRRPGVPALKGDTRSEPRKAPVLWRDSYGILGFQEMPGREPFDFRYHRLSEKPGRII
jgi:hypothetical protein